MKPHVKNALEARGIPIYNDEAPDIEWPCECCGRLFMLRSLDVHHILYRSKGGGDEAENTILLCVSRGEYKGCHDRAHGKIKGEPLSEETLFEHTRVILETIRTA